MTNGRAPEPTNEQLWAQPPAAYPAAPAQPANLPVPQPPHPPLVPQAQHPGVVAPGEPDSKTHGVLALAITSLALGVPLTAIASSEAGMGGMVVAWVGIVGVNAVYAWSRRGR